MDCISETFQCPYVHVGPKQALRVIKEVSGFEVNCIWATLVTRILYMHYFTFPVNIIKDKLTCASPSASSVSSRTLIGCWTGRSQSVYSCIAAARISFRWTLREEMWYEKNYIQLIQTYHTLVLLALRKKDRRRVCWPKNQFEQNWIDPAAPTCNFISLSSWDLVKWSRISDTQISNFGRGDV